MSAEATTSDAAPASAELALPPIDLRPLFAPRSIAVVGASARGGIAETVANNLRVMGSATRCHFVNPRYEELTASPATRRSTRCRRSRTASWSPSTRCERPRSSRTRPRAGVPSVIIPGGGVVEGGEAAARMQREVAAIARDHGIALLGPNCMGMVDLTTNAATYIGDVNPWLPRGGVAGIAQSGSVTDAFIHSGNRIGFSRIVGCGSEVVLDACDFLAYCLDDPETHAGHPVPRGLQAAGAVPRPRRPGARARQAGHGRQGRPQPRRPRLRRSPIPGRWPARRGRPTPRCAAAGVIRCDDLDELLETAELRRGLRGGWAGGSGAAGPAWAWFICEGCHLVMAAGTGIHGPPVPNGWATWLSAATSSSHPLTVRPHPHHGHDA